MPRPHWGHNGIRHGLTNTIILVRSVPNRADATISHNLLLGFTPAAGEILALGQPLPNGTFTRVDRLRRGADPELRAGHGLTGWSAHQVRRADERFIL